MLFHLFSVKNPASLWFTVRFAGDWVPFWSVTSAGEGIFAQRNAERVKGGGKLVCLEYAR